MGDWRGHCDLSCVNVLEVWETREVHCDWCCQCDLEVYQDSFLGCRAHFNGYGKNGLLV